MLHNNMMQIKECPHEKSIGTPISQNAQQCHSKKTVKFFKESKLCNAANSHTLSLTKPPEVNTPASSNATRTLFCKNNDTQRRKVY